MYYLNKKNPGVQKGSKIAVAKDLWFVCRGCRERMLIVDFKQQYFVCFSCNKHYPISAFQWLDLILDSDSFSEFDQHLQSLDPLSFKDTKNYAKRLEDYKSRLKLKDGLISGSGKICKQMVEVAVFDFAFMGGSMGCVVGEKIARTFLRAAKHKCPAIIISASGGARMQEGILSLMQMAKTCAALSILQKAGLPFISILANPTTGGVAASYAMMGDINIGEPGALIGFAGPRVIKQTIGGQLPKDFQTSEYLLTHGMLDLICSRKNLRECLKKIFDIICVA